jgi:hypothetical protein
MTYHPDTTWPSPLLEHKFVVTHHRDGTIDCLRISARRGAAAEIARFLAQTAARSGLPTSVYSGPEQAWPGTPEASIGQDLADDDEDATT